MQTLRSRVSARLLIVALYGLAMLLLPWAHRAMPAGMLGLADGVEFSAAYSLPDGSAPEICKLPGADGKPGGAGSGGLCEACLLTAAPGLGAVAAVSVPVPYGRATGPQTHPVRAASPRRLTGAGQPRAPPASLA